MAWIRIDDAYPDHAKHALVGPLGDALWLAGLSYCNRNLTDGFIPWAKARALISWDFLGPPDDQGRQKQFSISVSCGMAGQDVDSDFVIRLLLNAGLWEECAGGYQVHDYLDFQPSREEVLAQRSHLHEIRAEAGKRGAESRWQNSKPDGKPIANGMANEYQTDSKPHGKPHGNRMAPNPESRIPNPNTHEAQERESMRADKPRHPPFKPPNLSECIEAFKATAYPEEAEPFFDYYESNGWKVGPNRMQKLEAAVRNWIRRCEKHAHSRNGTPSGSSQTLRDLEEQTRREVAHLRSTGQMP